MLRTFIAIDFPPEILAKIAKIVAYFQSQTPAGALKWVTSGNLHLTLKFLGDVREDHLEAIKAGLQAAVRDQPAFEIGIEGLGMFPDASKPRAVWLGIQGAAPLTQIHHQLDQALQEEVTRPEKRPFSPHLTIARVRQSASRETTRQIGETLSQFKVDSLGTLKVETIQLYKSELTPKGPIYTTLLRAPLNFE